jgi:hypothetical protein
MSARTLLQAAARTVLSSVGITHSSAHEFGHCDRVSGVLKAADPMSAMFNGRDHVLGDDLSSSRDVGAVHGLNVVLVAELVLPAYPPSRCGP